MRYSMLVYLTRMGRTLLEAAEYLTARPKEDPMWEKLLENGRQMMDQIHAVLERHQQDLKSSRPIDCLNEAKEQWSVSGEECVSSIQQFVQCLPQEVRYQVRAVFFAELGEKWDAMESVYWIMQDDPRFDPVVVLTPYFRQIKKGGEMQQEVIYKDYLTPMGIPFFEHDKYNLEEDCPDLAFISQPYEGAALREFWPEYIAQYTRLVYLPYFLAYLAGKNSVTELAQMPVYRYAWKVICPTEKQYDFYCKHSVHNGVNALLTGIPKLDSLVSIPQKGIERPKGWEHLEGKCVFLWNSWYDIGVSSLRFFDDLLNWFKCHTDCVLLWRMHPLTDTVTKLYRADLYQDFLKKIRYAETFSNVVLDRETSYKAAFYYSDALISDYSSLLPQYLLMDKPALQIKRLATHISGEFIEGKWMENAENASDILAFLERVYAGEDRNAELRKMIRQRDLPLADGHCAQRVCEALWTQLHGEDL